MEKKNILIIVVMGIIIALVSGSGVFLWQRKVNEKQNDEKLVAVKQEMQEQIDELQQAIYLKNEIQEKNSKRFDPTEIDKLCAKNTIEQYGDIVEDKDIIVYKTECNNKGSYDDTLKRYYVRDAEGTFNREIFGMEGGVYEMRIVGERKDLISLYSCENGSCQEKIIDVYGNESEDLVKIGRSDTVSPNGKFVTSIEQEDFDYEIKNLIVKNTETGETTEYDFSENGLNGFSVVGWSSDNNIVYVSGGIYEFYAPAKLWKIDLRTGEKTEYEGLDGLGWPIHIYPEDGIAFLHNGNGFGSWDEKRLIDLYQLDLETGEKELIRTDSAFDAYMSFVKSGENIFYTFADEHIETNDIPENIINLRKMNLKTKEVENIAQGGAIRLFNSINEKNILMYSEGNYKIYFVDSGEEMDLGASTELWHSAPFDGKEYITNIVGVIKK